MIFNDRYSLRRKKKIATMPTNERIKMDKLIKSPLNYTGGKFKLLPQLLPLLPNKFETFNDIFCGGANVCMNINANKIIANDTNEVVIKLFNYFKSSNKKDVLEDIYNVINHYGLSDTSKNGYEYYKCESSKGLSPYNKDKFSLLKKDYNNPAFGLFNKNIMFYVLILFGFNNQIRFNKKGEYNMPVGKRDFNKNMKSHLELFLNKLETLNIEFKNASYEDMVIDPDSFIYADPPYLISTATYNESDGWNEDKEKELLSFLLRHTKLGGKFALSNVIEHKNKFNMILLEWVGSYGFNMIDLNYSYSNSSYHGKDKDSITKEVLITNYR